MSFFSVEDNVRFLLTKYPELRDGKNEDVIKKYHIVIDGSRSSETIVRVLRKVKEKYPEEFAPTKKEVILSKQAQTEKVLNYVRNEN